VEYSTFGSYPVTLTVSFDNCFESASSSVFIFREPTIDFRVEPGPRCAPALVQFTDESQADSPLLYSWNFGDGGSSTLQNPSHVFTQPGSYSVSLGVIATEGCIDTLYMMQQDAVTIHPSPVSNFSVSPEVTDICHPEVVFTDLSEGAEEIFYWFNDGGTFMDDAEPMIIYPFQNSGYHYPYQVATNEFGCRDTSHQEVYIEPFLIFIPNTFTPDGNEFNNDFNASYALEVLEWEFKIYDRWGEKVFETTDPRIAWDGVYMDEFGLVPSGTYTYVLRYVSCEFPDAWQMMTGHVNVLR